MAKPSDIQSLSTIQSDGQFVRNLNTIARKHLSRFKRTRKLSAATSKPAVKGGSGVAFGADKITV